MLILTSLSFYQEDISQFSNGLYILEILSVEKQVFREYTPGLSAQEYTSSDADIDRVRREVKRQKTTEENFRERHLMLYMWLGALQQQGKSRTNVRDLC